MDAYLVFEFGVVSAQRLVKNDAYSKSLALIREWYESYSRTVGIQVGWIEGRSDGSEILDRKESGMKLELNWNDAALSFAMTVSTLPISIDSNTLLVL
jgi:hypothetical protein